MKILSKISALAVSLTLVCSCMIFTSAESRWAELGIDASNTDNRVFDLADIYTDSEEKELNQQIEKVKSLTGWDIGIVTNTLGVEQWDMQAITDDIYDYCGFGKAEDNYSGALLVVDMNIVKMVQK